MKYPWMPLFWGDFLANTMHLSAQEAGAYLFLIAHAWENEGEIPAEHARLCRIAHVRQEWWKRVWKTLEPFFEPRAVGTHMCGYTHVRVTAELDRLGKISNKRKAAAVQMHSKSTRFASTSTSRSKDKEDANGKAGSLAGAPDGALASPPAEQAYLPTGMSPDVGDDYRSPPPAKPEHQHEMRELPDRPTSSAKSWKRYSDEELRALYAKPSGTEK